MELSILDENDSNNILGYLYLYLSSKLRGHANQNLVEYEFKLTKSQTGDSSDYKNVYQFYCNDIQREGDFVCDPEDMENLETSSVTTPFYKRGFSENW